MRCRAARKPGRGAGVPKRPGQTTQRRKMCPSCGAEIGLKAGSHPVGILPWDRGRAGDSGGASNPSAPFAGLTNGSRSPLWVRSTVMRSCPADKPAPVVGNDGNTIKAAVNKKSDSTPTALARRAVVPHIGSSPKRKPQSPMSRMRDGPCGPGAQKQRVRGRVVPQPHRPIGVGVCSQLRDHSARRLTPRSEEEEQTPRSRLVVRTGHPFPPPSVLGRPLWAQPIDRSVAP